MQNYKDFLNNYIKKFVFYNFFIYLHIYLIIYLSTIKLCNIFNRTTCSYRNKLYVNFGSITDSVGK